MSDDADLVLPPRPERPDDSDCCKNDCEMCIFTLYENKLAEWEKLCSDIKRKKCSKRLDLPSVLSQIKYTPFQLVSITTLTTDTNKYTFQISEKHLIDLKNEYSSVLNIEVGQHLIMKNKVGSNGCIITRAYTPISDVDTHMQGCFEVLIKLYPEGKMSNYIKSWTAGEIVHWRGPFGDFRYSRNEYEQVVMCCAGAGIAAMVRLIKSIVEDDEEETLVHLLYSCKKYEEMLMCDDISYFRAFCNFLCCLFVTQEIPQNVRYGETVRQGRITLNIVRKIVSEKSLEKTLVLICGTESFNEDMKKYALESGVLESNIRVF
ncbi:hypothetical protein R5R35_000254 [Gryllus longicercus]|uniref:FAD-binding FR-type domain-containing protein n=1 Tax=Gryllus longicercus TaxID=2509291 RepID=A0AAN9W188_9ORTH